MTEKYPRPPVTAVLSVADMRRSDAYTIAHFTDARTLMARAGQGIFDACTWHGRVAVVCGSGNNAGDGYVLAALLADAGVDTRIIILEEKFSSDGAYYFARARACGVPVSLWQAGGDLSGYDFVVDCIFGTGFHGEVRGIAADAIRAINASGAFVVSADINSGMNGDTGKGGPVVKSDLTVTIGYLKAGMLLGDAVWSIGKLVVADIGIRLIRDDYFLAKPEEAVFPHSDLSLDGDHVTLLTPGEAEDLSKAGQTIPDVAQELALRSRRLVRVLGRYALATDGYRTYFLEAGEYPQVIQVD